MFDYLLSLFRRKSVDLILSGINRSVKQLEKFAEAEANQALENRARAEQLVAEAKAREAEVQRAIRVSDRLTDILS